MIGEPLLQVSSLTMRRADGETLLEGVSLEVMAGESVAIVGESGSGKTLTCRAVLGSLPARVSVEGTIRFAGRDILSLPLRELREHRARNVALIAQDPRGAMNPLMRVGRFLTAVIERDGERESARSRAVSLLGTLGFSDPDGLMDRFPHELSGGMLQRIVVASALLSQPRLIIADEATSALDVTNQADVARMLRRCCHVDGAALVFVTHDLDLAAGVADRLVVMRDGQVVDIATPDMLASSTGHPYTVALAACRPSLDQVIRPLPTVPTTAPGQGGAP